MNSEKKGPVPVGLIALAGITLVVASNFVFGMDKTKFAGQWGKLLIYYVAAGLPIWFWDGHYGNEKKDSQDWMGLLLTPLVIVTFGMIVLQSILGRQF
jgi:hypothetical protein